MSAQPYVPALSVCGPAIPPRSRPEENGRPPSKNYAELFDLQREKPTLPQTRDGNVNVFLSSRENLSDKQSLPTNVVAVRPKMPQQQAAPSDQKTSKKCAAPIARRPPFVVGNPNNSRNNLALQKQQTPNVGNHDNRAEIADLKRQIDELSQLLRLHVDTKISKRDSGTDPIVFEKKSVDKATNTDSSGLCNRCRHAVNLAPSPTPSFGHNSPDNNGDVSLCSQLESLAMQYLSDDQLANIALGNDCDAVAVRKPDVGLQQRNRCQRDGFQEASPPRRRLAAVKTTTASSFVSPNFGASGELTLTRRHCVMTMEQEVSIFGNGKRGNEIESLPFGVSVASREFMQKHGVLKTAREKPPTRQAKHYLNANAGHANNYNQRKGYYQQNDGSSLVGRPRQYDYPQQRRFDAALNFDDQWD